MIDMDLWQTLADELSTGALVLDPDIIGSSSRDMTLFSRAGTAVALVRTKSTADVQATMRFASAHGLPMVPQGARTGASGGANAVDGAILLNVLPMNRILHIDPIEQTATVEPGVINQQLKDAAGELDLSYPPDPGSVALSSFGGNVATNAGGLCCVKYGVTRDYVRRLTVVLADGTVATVGRTTVKNSTGLDLCSLFIGSEGTLGIIVEVTLGLIPLLPDPITSVVSFPDESNAARAVADVMGAGARPSMLELLDRATLQMLSAYGSFGLDDTAGAILLVQTDGHGTLEKAQEELDEFAKIAQIYGAVDITSSSDPADSASLVQIRRLAQPAWEQYIETHGGGQLLDDICIPRSRLPDFYAWLAERKTRSPLLIGGVAHAGDGNVHPTVVFDKSKSDEVAEAPAIFDEIMALGLELGETISGEHGVGNLKSEWIMRELDPGERRLHRSIKDALDPRGILNPEKLFAHL